MGYQLKRYIFHKEEIILTEKYDLNKMIEGREQHYSDGKFLKKVKKQGTGLGMKALHAAATLFVALKSPDMPKSNKLIVLGALGYFILPFDLVADVLPLVGLTDDAFVILTALAKVYTAITDDMKVDAHRLLKEKFGEKYHIEDGNE